MSSCQICVGVGRPPIHTEYEKRKGSQVARHHIKDHRAKQLLVVPNDDKFVAVAAPEAFSRHSGTCMILGGQASHRINIFPPRGRLHAVGQAVVRLDYHARIFTTFGRCLIEHPSSNHPTVRYIKCMCTARGAIMCSMGRSRL